MTGYSSTSGITSANNSSTRPDGRSVAAFEWEMSKFQLEDNNVFTAGGTEPGPVSVQMNISDTATDIEGADLGD